MKQKQELVERIRVAIEEVSLGNIRLDRIVPESRLIADLGLDSLDYATVMLRVERWSGIKIRENEVSWAKIQTVNELATLFVEHQE